MEGEVLPFETLAFEKGKRIESEVMQGIIVEGNQNQLRQTVSVLLDNALSHGKGDSIAISLKRDNRAVQLTVKNDAERFSEEELSHLFDRFYRKDDARSEDGSHYGLGLSIAHAVVKAHGGNIRAEYKEGKAVFTVILPLKKN